MHRFESFICAPCQRLKYTYATEYSKSITNATREYGGYINTVVVYNFSDHLIGSKRIRLEVGIVCFLVTLGNN